MFYVGRTVVPDALVIQISDSRRVDNPESGDLIGKTDRNVTANNIDRTEG